MQYWLMKSEPDVWSIEQQKKAGTKGAPWDGVRNYQAAKNLKEMKATNARFTLTRDMHCWALSFNWIPLGGNKSFLFSIRSTSQLFRDAKIDIRKPPLFL